MKVIYILPISWGGTPHYSAELANAVAKYEDVTVIKPEDSNDSLFSDEVQLINAFKPLVLRRGREIGAFSFNNLCNFISYKNIQLVEKLKPDIIHFPSVYLHTSFFSAIQRLSKRYPLINTEHSVADAYLLNSNERKFIPTLLWRINDISKYLVKPDRIIVHTQENKNALIESGILPEKIAVISHGAYTFFKKFEETKTFADKNTLLFFGYLYKNKGLEFLLQAIPRVADEIEDLKVIIAGEGDISDYYKYINDESVYEIYNEYISNNKVAELFQRCKFLVLPYTYHQGHSGVLATALAFGKPSIVTNVGNLSDLGKQSVLVVPPKDYNALADAIIELFKNNQLRSTLAQNANAISHELSWDNIAQKHIQLYEDLINDTK